MPLPKPLFTIEGDGFDLVPLRETHLPLTLAWRNADDVRIWFKTSDVISEERHRAWYAAYAGRLDDFVFLIRPRGSEAFAGQLAIYGINHARREGELGRLIAAPKYRGRQLMESACTCLIRFAAIMLGIDRVHLEVLSTNRAAIGLYGKLGFRLVEHRDSLLIMELTSPWTMGTAPRRSS